LLETGGVELLHRAIVPSMPRDQKSKLEVGAAVTVDVLGDPVDAVVAPDTIVT
jgi:hypothetical protein